MCNRARMLGEAETILERFGADWRVEQPIDDRFTPQELRPFDRAWVIRQDDRGRRLDIMAWDILAGQAKRSARAGAPPRPLAMTNVRSLGLPQWRGLAERPDRRCLIPLTEFCEWSRDKDPDLGVKGEMWFSVTDQPIFAVAGIWQTVGETSGFTMVTCDPNTLVAPIHPKAMVTILAQGDWDRWLTGSYEDALALQQPYPAEHMAVRGPVLPKRSGEAAVA